MSDIPTTMLNKDDSDMIDTIENNTEKNRRLDKWLRNILIIKSIVSYLYRELMGCLPNSKQLGMREVSP